MTQSTGSGSHRTISSIAVIGMVLGLAACRTVPPSPIDPAANAGRLSARSLDDPAVKTALASYGLSAPADSTWSLDQLTVAAWVLQPTVAVARAEVEAAKADIRVQGQRPNPTLSLGPERVFSGAGGVNPWVLATAMTFPIETAGKRGIRRERAVASERSAEWQLGEVLWSARAAVRNALLAQTFAAQAVALDEREAALRSSYLDWINTRIKFGAATTQDRLAASQGLAEVESRRGTDNAALATASVTLAAAVGLRPDTFSSVMPATPDLDALPAFGATDLAGARDAALANRPDIRRALADYDVAEQDLKAAVAKQYPDIGFGPGYLFDQGEHKITLTVDLPVPLFNNGGAAIDAAIATRKVAAAKFDQIQANALSTIDSSFARYQANMSALRAASDAQSQAQSAFDTTAQIMKAGGADRGAMLAAEIALVTRLRNTLDARRAAVDALTALEDGIEKPIYPTSSLKPIGASAEQSNESRP